MATYTVDDLAERGARHAFALLLQHVRNGDEPFVTYGAIARLLENKLRIPRVFPTHIGNVAGRMIGDVHSVRKDAPLINALVTRPNGLPGARFGDFYNGKKGGHRNLRWEQLSNKQRLKALGDIRANVRRYPHWDTIYSKLYDVQAPRKIRPKQYSEKDGKPPDTNRPVGKGESEQHKILKQWALENPGALGLSKAMKGTLEVGLLSGDRVDVLFSDGVNFVAVEVKSVLSSVDDWKRGIYQCVKYCAVIKAQELPVPISVRSILLTEKELPSELNLRAKELKISLKVRSVNSKR